MRPDFQILFYPVITLDGAYTHYVTKSELIGSTEDAATVNAYSPEQNIDTSTPSAFIAVCKDDDTVNPINSEIYHKSLKAHEIPSVLKIYDKGGHGWGDNSPCISSLKSDLTEWIQKELHLNYNHESTSTQP